VAVSTTWGWTLQAVLSLGEGTTLPAFSLVFAVEMAVAVALALLLLSRVNLRQFREDTGRGASPRCSPSSSDER
jgi:MFS transporter, BCD family, chlorophyll transporter